MYQGSLTIITEGDRHQVAYLLENGLKADSFILEPIKMKGFVPYIKMEDNILLIIKGLTDFTMADIYTIVDYVNESSVASENFIVMSNIELGDVDFPYYFYKGDIFWGDIQYVVDGKKYEIDNNGTVKATKNKGFIDSIASKQIEKERQGKVRYNPILKQYIDAYPANRKLVNGQVYIYDGVKEEERRKFKDTDIDKIIRVDLFKK